MRLTKPPFKNAKIDFDTYAGTINNVNEIARNVSFDNHRDKYRFRVGKVIKNNLNTSFEIGEVFYNRTDSEWQFVGDGGWWWATNTLAVPYQSQRFEDAKTLNSEVLTVGDLVHVYSDPRSRTWNAVPAPKGWKQLLIRTLDYPNCVYSSYLPDSRFAYIMDGVDDHLDIQSALNEIKDNGGRIFYYGNNSYLSGTISVTDIKENMTFISTSFRDVPGGPLKSPVLNANATYATALSMQSSYWADKPNILFYNFQFQNQPATQINRFFNAVGINLDCYLFKTYGYQNVKNEYFFVSGSDEFSTPRINLTNCTIDAGGTLEQKIVWAQYVKDLIVNTCQFSNTNPTYSGVDNRVGVYALGCERVVIKNSTIEKCGNIGLMAGGINFPIVKEIELDNVKLNECRIGGSIYCNEANLVACNTSYNSSIGLTLIASRPSRIRTHASSYNGSHGLNTSASRIESSTFNNNTGDGIFLRGSIEHIKNTNCLTNGGSGLYCNNFDIDRIQDSTFSTNQTHGIDGTGAGADVLVIKDCTASSNTSTGISLKNVDSITNTTCSSNGGHGFSVTSIMNMCTSSASSNGGNGISCTNCGQMVKCTTSSNTVNGVGAVNGGSITAPTATGNGGVDFVFSGCGPVINYTGTPTTSGQCVLFKVDQTQASGTIDLTTASEIVVRKTGVIESWS